MITLEQLEALRDKLCKEKDEEKHHPDWKEGHIIGTIDMFNGTKELLSGGGCKVNRELLEACKLTVRTMTPGAFPHLEQAIKNAEGGRHDPMRNDT